LSLHKKRIARTLRDKYTEIHPKSHNGTRKFVITGVINTGVVKDSFGRSNGTGGVSPPSRCDSLTQPVAIRVASEDKEGSKDDRARE